MSKDPKSYYVTIPGPVLDDPDLAPAAKILFGRLVALASEKGYAYGSDSALAEMNGTAVYTVRDHLKALEEGEYIKRVGAGRSRRIYPTNSAVFAIPYKEEKDIKEKAAPERYFPEIPLPDWEDAE